MSSGDRKPPPLIPTTGDGMVMSSRETSPDERPKNNKGGAKRTKYRSDEERQCKEKERRNANNQRER